MRILHPIAGTTALTTIVCFWLATVLSETLGSQALVTTVKTTIPWGFLILIPALAATGISGRARGKAPVKTRRMAVAAFVGLCGLIPAALFLAARASHGQFDTAFSIVQALELGFGALNIWLLSLNLRDGLRLRRGYGKPAKSTQPGVI